MYQTIQQKLITLRWFLLLLCIIRCFALILIWLNITKQVLPRIANISMNEKSDAPTNKPYIPPKGFNELIIE